MLFQECYQAYRMGRADQDPSMNWYHGEIGFFDFYVIPLAKKLKECGVFGVSSDEYLNYALQNREEWVTRGEEIIHEMMRKNRNHMSTWFRLLKHRHLIHTIIDFFKLFYDFLYLIVCDIFIVVPNNECTYARG
jgi:hypothetical protein